MNIPEETIEKFIKSLTLEEMNSVEVFAHLDDCRYICIKVYEKFHLKINPVHAYWLWSVYSSGLSASWMYVENLDWFFDTLKDERFYVK